MQSSEHHERVKVRHNQACQPAGQLGIPLTDSRSVPRAITGSRKPGPGA